MCRDQSNRCDFLTNMKKPQLPPAALAAALALSGLDANAADYRTNPFTLTYEGAIPVGARRLPLVFWHGFGQFSKTWETTPDGREGFQNIFLRRGFPVYVIDQPRRGGDVTVVHLPEIGIRGNTHFPFSDLNNLEIADLMSEFLKTKGLD